MCMDWCYYCIQKQIFSNDWSFIHRRICLAPRINSGRVKRSILKNLACLLFFDYSEGFINFYGAESILINILYIIHILDDVDRLSLAHDVTKVPFDSRKIKSGTWLLKKSTLFLRFKYAHFWKKPQLNFTLEFYVIN